MNWMATRTVRVAVCERREANKVIAADKGIYRFFVSIGL